VGFAAERISSVRTFGQFAGGVQMHVHPSLYMLVPTGKVSMPVPVQPGGDENDESGLSMTGEPRPALRVYTFTESDYRFGVGPLRMTVERVDWGKPVLHDGENWYDVQGVELTWDGREVGHRQAMVRGSRLSGWRSPVGRDNPGSLAKRSEPGTQGRPRG